MLLSNEYPLCGTFCHLLIMNLLDYLPKNLLSRQPKITEHFFAINISSHTITAALWTIDQKRLRIINVSKGEFDHENELTEVANHCLDEVLADYPVDPSKVLFGVPDHWLQDDNLKDEYLNLLKKLVKDLDVEPMAYVSTSYSIAHLEQRENGVPLTAILINLEDPLSVAVVKGGKILGTTIQKRAEDLGLDIEKALLKFAEIEVLPSKILVYSSSLSEEELSKTKDNLQSFAWMNNLQFLHMPKIETLQPSTEIESICLAGASEIEPDVVYQHQPLAFASNLTRHQPLHKIDSGEVPTGKAKDSLSQEPDFMEGDIESLEQAKGVAAADVAADLMGDNFAAIKEGGEVYEDEYGEPFPAEDEKVPAQSRSIQRPQFAAPQRSQLPAVWGGSLVQKLLATPVSIWERVQEFLPAGRGGKLFSNRTSLILAIVVVVLLVSYVILPKAKVTLFIDQKILEKDAEVIADPTITTVDDANNKIPGKIVEIDENGSDKGTATGKKTVGNPAKGNVIIYNATSDSIILSAGTTLINDAGLKYTLDKSVPIASKSASAADPPMNSGPVGITASNIGPESNLPPLKSLKVGNYAQSDVVAKADSDISGGTSKDVTVVTADDQKSLLAKVSAKLRSQAQSDLQGKLSGDMKILPEALNETIGKTVYSKSVGDQTSDFTLNLSAHYKGTAYNQDDLKQIVSKLVQTNVPDGYTLNLPDTETQSAVSKLDKDNKLYFSAKFKAKLMPKIDIEALKKQLVFKSPSQVAEIVRKNETVIGSDIKTSFVLPAALTRMPLLARNISIEVVAK